MTRHAAIRTVLDAKRLLRRRRSDAAHALATALALLAGTVLAQPSPAASSTSLAAALQDLSPLARMLVGAATGRSTAAAGVPALTGSARNTDRALTLACAEINRFTPVPLDRETALAQCSLAQKKNLVFLITLTNYAAHSAASQGFRLNFVPILQKNICNNGDVRILTRLGLSLIYRYRGNDHEMVGDVPINETICGTL
ncbi:MULTISPECIES: hypothetical protein [Ralstonia solanacearum species complex]|uniref:hypothetical protein n=1 Tax=Ralstonia solanacearum species complex TaxID=3116862 RepID=UPI000E590EF7|nr:hypothetical protein [Ralstonia solanacearum]BEU71466.1 hypothetical protein MAFF211271_10210 [Ralstonia pseudosolanacearum]AXV76419.1 hypothetical protein CJO76_05190 [Ralstonia solanacearum]AXV90431.1 hypothetical protein CJO79_05180 [Ralstonia solanacearum]AXW18606.1 hypothetical protein CJO85_05230 [Ralstonia solanacearum]AXW75344.1 hypothetical protein CJO97_05190 [Ralstonia solanacearum]